MCGITGVIDLQAASEPSRLTATIRRMTAALVRRGPDDEGVWINASLGLGLGQRRLAVLELSELGHQPILSSTGRYAMTYNGEIYNFVELGNELKKVRDDFAPSSDTQVMMAAFEQWGVRETVQRLEGMFAIICLDHKNNTLHVARDRLGEKPMYIGCHENKILFASELKAMQAVFETQPSLNTQALTLFLRHGYVPGPLSIYQNIHKLPAANIVSIDLHNAQQHVDNPQSILDLCQPYWRLAREDDKVDRTSQAGFESLLQGVVGRQMRADVPLGAFLSGGVDSSAVVALMQKHSASKVRTFSIGFEDLAFNEAPYASEVARHLDTEHHEQILGAREIMGIIPDLAQIYDEPFADSSQLPTILVSRMAREHVTVCLSGDGGDELFGGYERYYWAQKVWKWCSWMPLPSRKVIAGVLSLLVSISHENLPAVIQQRIGKIERLVAMLSAPDRQHFYRALISSQTDPQKCVVGGQEGEYGLSRPTLIDSPFLHQMMFLDIHNYLPDDILAKVDRASMYSSLELRAPLLDHHVVEYAWNMRDQTSGYGNNSKAVLRNILYQYVPKALIERPKKGFAIPLESWLRGPLREWAENYINPTRLRREGILDADVVMSIWQGFQLGKPGAAHFLWNVLMFQLWHETWSQ